MANLLDGAAKRHFWKRDLLAKWKSGEFIEPEPGAKRRHLLRTLALCLVVLIGLYMKPVVNEWQQSDMNSLDALARTNPQAAAEKGALILKYYA